MLEPHTPVRPAELLLQSMCDPASMAHLGTAALDGVLHAARQHRLLGRLEHDLARLGVVTDLPATVGRQLASARGGAHANAIVLRFEIDRVRRALADLGTRIVLLKGAAYLRAGLPPSRGRLSVDLDILVPAADIGRVEQRLLASDWRPEMTDRYDQHYYRDWMHEIPPLVHRERRTELDVHHTIFPPVSGVRIDTEALLADATPIDAGLWVPSPADMVLHAATHLFLENPAGGLRDLLDLHDLLTLFGQSPGFWDILMARAHRHRLGRPLYYALRYSARMTGTAVPAAVLDQAEAAFAPNMLPRRAMDWLVRATIVRDPPGRANRGVALANSILFARAHWIKMPLGVLAGHLATKAFRKMREERKPPVGAGGGV